MCEVQITCLHHVSGPKEYDVSVTVQLALLSFAHITKSHMNLKYPKIRFQSFIRTEHTLDGCVVGRNLYNTQSVTMQWSYIATQFIHGYRERRNLLERVLQCHCSPVHHLRCMDQPIQSSLLQLCYATKSVSTPIYSRKTLRLYQKTQN